jgi:hypothetical protein
MNVLDNLFDLYEGMPVEIAAISFLNHRGFNSLGNPTFNAWAENRVRVMMGEGDVKVDRVFD